MSTSSRLTRATLLALVLGLWPGLACTELKALDTTPGSFAWVYHTADPIVTSPVIDGEGNIYLVAGKTVHAVYDDGSPRWTFLGGDRFNVSPAIGETPARTVYAVSETGTLYALAADGTKRFEKALGGSVTQVPPVVAGNRVLVLLDSGVLVALDDQGNEQFRTAAGDTPVGPAVVGPDGTIYVSTLSKLRAFTSSGALRWTVERAAHGSVAIDPQGGTLYVMLSNDLYKVDPVSGKETLLHTFDVPAGTYTPLLAGDLIYLAIGNQLVAVNKGTGEKQGAYTATVGLHDCIRLPSQTGRLYVQSDKGPIGLKADLSETWAVDELQVSGSCAAFGDAPNRLFVGTIDKRLFAINLLPTPGD